MDVWLVASSANTNKYCFCRTIKYQIIALYAIEKGIHLKGITLKLRQKTLFEQFVLFFQLRQFVRLSLVSFSGHDFQKCSNNCTPLFAFYSKFLHK